LRGCTEDNRTTAGRKSTTTVELALLGESNFRV